jgi:septum formation protein
MTNTTTQPLLVLASQSPRRYDLLSGLGLEFKVMPSLLDEIVDPAWSPYEIVLNLSLQKAQDVALKLKDEPDFDKGHKAIVIGADTMVVLNGKVLGKPISTEDAIAMLTMLSGNFHQVYTGVTLVCLPEEKIESTVEVSRVLFRTMSPAEIESYVTTKEPMDKAGSYALQGLGSAFVKRIEGCYTNIIGLPVPATVALLRKFGVIILNSGS